MADLTLQEQVEDLERAIEGAGPGQLPELRDRLAGIVKRLNQRDPGVARARRGILSRRAVAADEDFFENMPV